MKYQNKYKLNRGLTMIEVLIAIVILAIGLLGIAGLQVAAMRNNNSANYRTQATLLLNEFGDILRANLTQDDKVIDNTFGTMADDDSEYSSESPGAAPAADTPCLTTTVCSKSAMATMVRYNWAKSVSDTLPNSVATTERKGEIYTVSIAWLDDRQNNKTVTFITGIRP